MRTGDRWEVGQVPAIVVDEAFEVGLVDQEK
jgi:hypothetical protein